MEKRCPVCTESKLLEEFNSQRTRCLVCHREANRKWREENLEKNRASQRAFNATNRIPNPEMQKSASRKHYEKNKETLILKSKVNAKIRNTALANLLLDYFESHACVDCGESNPLKLTFDHVRGVKSFSVGDAYRLGFSHTKVMAEIEKCDVKCFNCHMEKTAIEKGFTLYKALQERRKE